MPNHSVYRRQAEKNENTAKAAQSGFFDWAVIMCFYAALHWVNDYAFRNNEMGKLEPSFYVDENGKKPSEHGARLRYVKRVARRTGYMELETAYKNLFAESMKARYLQGLEEEDCTAVDHYKTVGVQFCFDYLEKVKKGLP
ncbi:hypothetical protein NDA03_26435 [Trichocoleus sp. Lan]|uniref:hypothetical protein n=1 Tax=Trichocoleus sp. Lan TaxID=2933927 RepID=UPI00329A66EB